MRHAAPRPCVARGHGSSPVLRRRPPTQPARGTHCLLAPVLRPALAATAAAGRAVASAGSSSPWQAVVDPGSGKEYWWNTETGETTWAAPHQPAGAAREAGSSPATPPGIGFDELEALLLATEAVYLSKVVEPHRDSAFSDAFTEHLTAKIEAATSAGDKDSALRLEKLRARLANPLIRQPPPFL